MRLVNTAGAAALFGLLNHVAAQSGYDTIGLENGYLNFTVANWQVGLIKDSQILGSLRPAGSDYDFSPSDYLEYRAGNGQYHTGDINLRYRELGSSNWLNASTASDRQYVTALKPSQFGPNVLAVSDLAPTLPAGVPFKIVRQWIKSGNELGLTFTLTNTGPATLQLGAVGFPIEFNSIFTNRPNIDAVCSLTDPSIGEDGGYLRVAPMSGLGPALAVTPIGHTPLQAWSYLMEQNYTDIYYDSQVFEGFYEWQALTLAFAQSDWINVQPWNKPSSLNLNADQSVTWGLRFNLASSIWAVEEAVIAAGIPHVVSVPGYIIPEDLTAKLFINSTSPVKSFTFNPPNAATITPGLGGEAYEMTPTGSAWGRVRLTIHYADGKTHVVSYYFTKSAPDALADLGNFLFTKQWFTNDSDPFNRAPSVISYDNIAEKQVVQDERVWIAGLSDEGGAGSWLAAAMKQSTHPNAAEVKKLDQYLMQTVHGVLQPSNTSDPFSVRKSVFFYEPALVPNYTYDASIWWGNWWSWNRANSYATDRAYDYVHVTAAWWAMYRVARDYAPGAAKALVASDLAANAAEPSMPWSFYLAQAYQTIMRCVQQDANGDYTVGYVQVGLMGETVWGEILKDLQREGMTVEAANVESAMKARADYWNTLPNPFGSEMAWDSTGQEGVYYWTNYFGYAASAAKTIQSIFGYMPAVSHWGWNGNARRYWDFIYAGKLMRYERMIHHYGSGLNALPMLAYFRRNTTDTLALRTGYGGMNGPLSNIGRSGSSSQAFHSWPDTLMWDGYTGDYGPNHLGLVLGTAVYITNDASLGGLVAFGANYVVSGNTITVRPRDAGRQKIFIGPLQLMITISAGAIDGVIVNTRAKTVQLSLVNRASSASIGAKQTIVWLSDGDETMNGSATPYYITSGGYPIVRQGSQVPLNNGLVTLSIGHK